MMNDKSVKEDERGVKNLGSGRSLKTKSTLLGRPTLFEQKLSPSEICARFNKSVRDSGGRIMTVRLRNKEACEALVSLVKERKFNSETAAATWILEQSLIKLKSTSTQILKR